MSYDYGFGILENQLVDLCKKYPPDFDQIEALFQAGANPNAYLIRYDEEENLLTEIILGYPFYYFEDNENTEEKSNWDGRYLPRIVKCFLANGLDTTKHGLACLNALVHSAHDKYIIDVVKLILNQGVSADKESWGDLLESICLEESYLCCTHGDHETENIYYTFYELVDTYRKGKSITGIDLFSACIGKRIDAILIMGKIENTEVAESKDAGRMHLLFESCMILNCEGHFVQIESSPNIFVVPGVLSDDLRDCSYIFGNDVVGHKIISIEFTNDCRMIKERTFRQVPVIYINLDNDMRLVLTRDKSDTFIEAFLCHKDKELLWGKCESSEAG